MATFSSRVFFPFASVHSISIDLFEIMYNSEDYGKNRMNRVEKLSQIIETTSERGI